MYPVIINVRLALLDCETKAPIRLGATSSLVTATAYRTGRKQRNQSFDVAKHRSTEIRSLLPIELSRRRNELLGRAARHIEDTGRRRDRISADSKWRSRP